MSLYLIPCVLSCDVIVGLKLFIAQMCFYPSLTYRLPLFRPRCEYIYAMIYLWNFDGSLDTWRAVERAGASIWVHFILVMVVTNSGYSSDFYCGLEIIPRVSFSYVSGSDYVHPCHDDFTQLCSMFFRGSIQLYPHPQYPRILMCWKAFNLFYSFLVVNCHIWWVIW